MPAYLYLLVLFIFVPSSVVSVMFREFDRGMQTVERGTELVEVEFRGYLEYFRIRSLKSNETVHAFVNELKDSIAVSNGHEIDETVTCPVKDCQDRVKSLLKKITKQFSETIRSIDGIFDDSLQVVHREKNSVVEHVKIQTRKRTDELQEVIRRLVSLKDDFAKEIQRQIDVIENEYTDHKRRFERDIIEMQRNSTHALKKLLKNER